MKLVKALVSLNMARSNAEANRLVKQGSVWIGGCIPPCNARMAPYKCTCNGWHKSTNPTEEVSPGIVIRIKDGSWRLLAREDGRNGFDQIPGIGRVPEPLSAVKFDVNVKGAFVDEIQLKFWKAVFAIRSLWK
jgi:hypothetical protein